MEPAADEFPRVLLINPNTDQNSLWAPLLWWWGYDVQVFERQLQGLMMLAEQHFDILVWCTSINDEVSAYIRRILMNFKVPTIAVVDGLRRNVQYSRQTQTGLYAVVRTPVTVHIDYLAATVSDALGESDVMGKSDWMPTTLIDRAPSEMDEQTEAARFRLASRGIEKLREDSIKLGAYGRSSRKRIAHALRRYSTDCLD